MTDVENAKHFQDVKRVCLIGGGDIMAYCAEHLKAKGIEVGAILAPRHADESLAILGGTLSKTLAGYGAKVHLTDNINDTSTWSTAEYSGPDALALCFGPSWIFSDEAIQSFGHGMVNINPIPVPHYLGGAHFTWQILNDNRTGGCFIQEITSDLDRGPIILAHRFDVPPQARTPADYFQAYYDECTATLDRFIDHLVNGESLTRVPYDTVDGDRIYFPRLMTVEQAFIDWSWSAKDIEKFCNAFDDPYAGAMSFISGDLVRVKNVSFAACEETFHPFCSGLVVRKLGADIYVAATHGLLHIGEIVNEAGASVASNIKEGMRLITPSDKLEHAKSFRPLLSAKGFAKTGGAPK